MSYFQDFEDYQDMLSSFSNAYVPPAPAVNQAELISSILSTQAPPSAIQTPLTHGMAADGGQNFAPAPVQAAPFVEVDAKNLGMLGLSQEEYNAFRQDLSGLNERYTSTFRADEEAATQQFVDALEFGQTPANFLTGIGPSEQTHANYVQDFRGVVDSHGVNPIVQGTDKTYYLDPGMPGVNPYGTNAQFNDPTGTREGMFTRDTRTTGQFNYKNAVLAALGTLVNPVNWLGGMTEGSPGVPFVKAFSEAVNAGSERADHPDIEWQPADVSDTLGDVQVQIPNFQLPWESSGGGAATAPQQPAPQQPAPAPSQEEGEDTGDVQVVLDPERDPTDEGGDEGGEPSQSDPTAPAVEGGAPQEAGSPEDTTGQNDILGRQILEAIQNEEEPSVRDGLIKDWEVYTGREWDDDLLEVDPYEGDIPREEAAVVGHIWSDIEGEWRPVFERPEAGSVIFEEGPEKPTESPDEDTPPTELPEGFEWVFNPTTGDWELEGGDGDDGEDGDVGSDGDVGGDTGVDMGTVSVGTGDTDGDGADDDGDGDGDGDGEGDGEGLLRTLLAEPGRTIETTKQELGDITPLNLAGALDTFMRNSGASGSEVDEILSLLENGTRVQRKSAMSQIMEILGD